MRIGGFSSPYSTAAGPASAPSSDFVWIVSSALVFGPCICWCDSVSTREDLSDHLLRVVYLSKPADHHPVKPTAVAIKPAAVVVEEKPVEEDVPVEEEDNTTETVPEATSVEAQVQAGEPASKPKDLNEVAREDGDEGEGEPAEQGSNAGKKVRCPCVSESFPLRLTSCRHTQ